MPQTLTTKNYQTPKKTHLAQVVSSTKGIKAGSVKSSAMTLVIKQLLVQPGESADGTFPYYSSQEMRRGFGVITSCNSRI
jgi:hypothetical protein